MRQARMRNVILWYPLVFALAGCAAVPAPTGGAVPVPAAMPVRAAEPVTARDEPRREPVRGTAARDSTPSADALRVLAAIPEPLAPSQQVPPPRSTPLSSTPAAPRSAPVRAPEAAYDTLRVGSEGDTAGVPVPSPTQPLGSATGPTLTMPDTLPPPVSAPAVAEPVKPVVTPPSPAPKSSEPCWRLQVAAPAERPKAESRRDAAQSLLTVPFTIEFEKGLYKVRTRDCLTRAAADALKRRAADSGFEGVFLTDTHAAAVAPVRKPAARAVVKKKPRR